MGQLVVFSHPITSPWVSTTLKTPYSYPSGHHSYWFVTKNGRKRLKNMFLMFTSITFYPQICFKGQWVVFNCPMVSYKVPTTLMTPYIYPMGHLSHSFVRKNGRKRLKKRFLTMPTSITSYSTHKYFLRANDWHSVILWYQPRCLIHLWALIL
jgi:hypothetical protein